MHARITILLAEDNPGDVFLVRRALEKHGLEVEVVVVEVFGEGAPQRASGKGPQLCKGDRAESYPLLESPTAVHGGQEGIADRAQRLGVSDVLDQREYLIETIGVSDDPREVNHQACGLESFHVANMRARAHIGYSHSESATRARSNESD